eukprot:353682-Chlamydomonas_euryale.AAC.2
MAFNAASSLGRLADGVSRCGRSHVAVGVVTGHGYGKVCILSGPGPCDGWQVMCADAIWWRSYDVWRRW